MPDESKPPYVFRSLRPESSAKPQPDYIPEALRTDYSEACLICDLSPKAAATLARRCLQGMIWHFAHIKRRTLFEEINALRTAVENGEAPPGVTLQSVEGIEHVRGIGNIGAHMETDIGVIIEVDPEEARVLIELIEMLFKEWYVAAHQRQESLARLKQIADEKKIAKNAPKAIPDRSSEQDDELG